jgi:hypothetical protein
MAQMPSLNFLRKGAMINPDNNEKTHPILTSLKVWNLFSAARAASLALNTGSAERSLLLNARRHSSSRES